MRPIIRSLLLAGSVAATFAIQAADVKPTSGAAGKTTVETESPTGRTDAPSREQQADRLHRAVLQLFSAAKARAHTDGDDARGFDTVVLDERYAVFSVAHIDGDGHLSTVCVTGAAEAETARDAGSQE
jgi:hypothetical protein